MENIQVLYSETEVQKRVAELAQQIDADYRGRTVTVISILKGAVFFTVDLMRKMETPTQLEVMQVSSYEGTESTGKIRVKKDLDGVICGKDVLIVEDIIDTGYTMHHLLEYLWSKQPHSLKLAALLDKQERRKAEVAIDYTGFVVPDKFIVGYGLDFDEQYRDLPYVGVIGE